MAHTIHHQPTLVVLQSLGWQLERLSSGTWCYMMSHENYSNYSGTQNCIATLNQMLSSFYLVEGSAGGHGHCVQPSSTCVAAEFYSGRSIFNWVAGNCCNYLYWSNHSGPCYTSPTFQTTVSS